MACLPLRAGLARAAAIAIVLSIVPAPALAAPLAALPATVRVNIAGLGTSYAAIGSTGTINVTTADGKLVYRGPAKTFAHRDVQRVAGPVSVGLPNPLADLGDRRNRLQLIREMKAEARTEAVPIITVPFEFGIEQREEGPLQPPLISAQAIVPLFFSTTDGLLTYHGKIFRGTLELTTDDAGDMIVVNEVDTRSYIASVVGSEEPTTWMPEALAAQAIAARTYLATHLRRHQRYDLEGDVRDQEYTGLGGEAESTLRAVDRTEGIIATYRGAPIEALYSANAGGWTEDSENVYSNALPYLRAVASPYDDVAQASSWGHTSWRWTSEFTAPQLASYLQVRGIDVGEPQHIELMRLTKTGRVLSARIHGTRGSRDIGKDASRWYFGLRSSMYTVAVRPAETEIVNRSDADRIRQLEALGAKVVTTYTNSIRDPERGRLRVQGWAYQLPARFVFTGRGYGHGVGMSQWGAQGMALAGKSAEEILKHYYLGIALTHVGGP